MFYRLVSRSILLQRLKLALAGAEKDPGGRGHNNSQLKKRSKRVNFSLSRRQKQLCAEYFSALFLVVFWLALASPFPLFGRKQDVNVNAKVDELEDRREMFDASFFG